MVNLTWPFLGFNLILKAKTNLTSFKCNAHKNHLFVPQSKVWVKLLPAFLRKILYFLPERNLVSLMPLLWFYSPVYVHVYLILCESIEFQICDIHLSIKTDIWKRSSMPADLENLKKSLLSRVVKEPPACPVKYSLS